MIALKRVGSALTLCVLALGVLATTAGASEFAGRYEGTFAGAASGSWHMEVYCGGTLYLVEHTEYERFYGWVDPAGLFTADGTRDTLLAGSIAPSGTVSGQWENEYGEQGTFTGSLQERYECDCPTEALYGTDAWQTQRIRDFRDQTLLHSTGGRALVRLYYAISPTLARQLYARPRAARWARATIDTCLGAIE